MCSAQVTEVCHNVKWMRGLTSFQSRKKNAGDLELVRTSEVHLIPRRLFQHVPDRVFEPDEIDRIYEFGPLIFDSPTNLLYLMVDKSSREIHGVLWASVNVVSTQLSIFLLSVDRAYRSSDLPTLAAGFLFGQPFDWTKVKPVVNFCTSRPHIWEQMGCQRHPLTQMSMTKEWFDDIEREMRNSD